MSTISNESNRFDTATPALMNAQQQIQTDLMSTIKQLNFQGRDLTAHDKLTLFKHMLSKRELTTYVHLLPLLLNLKGEPYTLADHFPFEPIFRIKMPSQMVYVTARQTSKSTSNAASEVVLANVIPYFNTLTITPLFEQIRRFSANYVKPFIEQSPIKDLWVNSSTVQSVLQRTFRNYSNLYFSFALLDAERVRGISADRVVYDEVQDLDPAHIPIIREVMSHSKWELTQYTGTPKSFENTIQGLWNQSSQAQWMTPCSACHFENYACVEMHLYKMIGPMRHDISPQNPAVVCANCGRPIHPKIGRWMHKHPERRWKFAGYHIPQVIMPRHYGIPEKWAILRAKQRGEGGTTAAVFHNEVLGESYDHGAKLVTKTELIRAGCLHENVLQIALEARKKYDFIVLGVDWGGGGAEEISFTTISVNAWNAGSERVDVIYGEQLFTPNEHVIEAKRVCEIYNIFRAHIIAHDYTGAGNLRETFLIQSGILSDRLMPIQYVRAAAQNILNFIPATVHHPKNYWRADKSRSLQLLCHCIKTMQVRFFKYDEPEVRLDEDSRIGETGLLGHFLALVENKITTSRVGEIYTIQRNPLLCDDFAQSVNFGCLGLWHAMSAWPSVGGLKNYELNSDQSQAVGDPDHAGDWDATDG